MYISVCVMHVLTVFGYVLNVILSNCHRQPVSVGVTRVMDIMLQAM